MTFDEDFARLLKESEMPGPPRGDLARAVRARFARRRKRRGAVAAGCASIAVIATVVPLSLAGGRAASPAGAPATPLLASGACAGTSVTAAVLKPDGSRISQEILSAKGNPALTASVGQLVELTATGPCAGRIEYTASGRALMAPVDGEPAGSARFLANVAGQETVTIKLGCDGPCRAASPPDTLATVSVVVPKGAVAASDLELWHGQDGTLATARQIPCGPGPTGSNPAVAQEERDTNTLPSIDQLTPPHGAMPVAPPTSAAGEHDYGQLRFAPPPAGAHPAVCATLAVQIASHGQTGSTTGGPLLDVRLALFSSTDPAHINADGSSTPYFTDVLAWEVVYPVDAACYGPPGKCPSGPIPADGVMVVDATTGQVLVSAGISPAVAAAVRTAAR